MMIDSLFSCYLAPQLYFIPINHCFLLETLSSLSSNDPTLHSFSFYLCWFFLLYCMSQYQNSSRLWPSFWMISSFLKGLNCIEMLEIPSVYLRPSHPFLNSNCLLDISSWMFYTYLTLNGFPISFNGTIIYSEKQIRIIMFISLSF